MQRPGSERTKLWSLHPPMKLFTSDISQIVYRKNTFFFRDQKIHRIELAGYVFNPSNRGCYLLDFFGPVFIYGASPLEAGTHKVICLLAYNGGVRCRGAEYRRICFYEEVFFWKEVVDYKKKLAGEQAWRSSGNATR